MKVGSVIALALATVTATPQMSPTPSSQPLAELGSPSPGCLSGEPSLPPGYSVREEVRGDFDGDGRADRLQLVSSTTTNERTGLDEEEQLVRVIFARGVSTPLQDAFGGERVIGVVDLNGEPGEEVLVNTGGNTWYNAGILVVRGCAIQPATVEDGTVYWFGYHAHSNGCLGCGDGFVCPMRGSSRRLVQIDYQPDVDLSDFDAVFRALDDPGAMYRWRRRTLRLIGTKVVAESEETGRTKGIDPNVPMINRFSCAGEDPPS